MAETCSHGCSFAAIAVEKKIEVAETCSYGRGFAAIAVEGKMKWQGVTAKALD